MQRLIDHGHLGNKTPDHGGFYRRVKEGKQTISLVLDAKTGAVLWRKTPARSSG